MHSTYAAPRAWPGPLAMVLVLLGLLAMPVPAHAARSQARPEVAPAYAGWHGRAIEKPRPRPRLARVGWPKGWSAGAVKLGTGYSRPGGSDRVREVQRRLTRLGYRPGPVDGLFGPRTRAAARWFQFKHGLAVTGRVNRSTLAVLQARSDHEPLPTKTARDAKPAQPTPAGTAEPTPGGGTADAPEPTAVPEEGIGVTWIIAGLLFLLALVLGVTVGVLIPELRRLNVSTPPPTRPALPRPTPVPVAASQPRRSPATNAPRVLGYATVNGNDAAADAATAALALRCARRGWLLVEVIHDRREPAKSLSERPGLTHAINAIRHGAARGLVVAHIWDVTPRVSDLATLLTWLEDADAFLGAADHELDTSTRAGRATARAVVELARWDRDRVGPSTHDDLTVGRFTPASRATPADITDQIAAMHDRGLSFRAIADALNLARVAGPAGHTSWRITDVRAAKEESRTS